MFERFILVSGGTGFPAENLRLAIGDIAGANIQIVEDLTALRRAMRDQMPQVIVAPWSDGGVTLLGTRAAMYQTHPKAPQPVLLALTAQVTPAKIALAKSSGGVELIPTDPLDGMGLRNRLILILKGAGALGVQLQHDQNEFEQFLEGLPALRKRLAA